MAETVDDVAQRRREGDRIGGTPFPWYRVVERESIPFEQLHITKNGGEISFGGLEYMTKQRLQMRIAEQGQWAKLFHALL